MKRMRIYWLASGVIVMTAALGVDGQEKAPLKGDVELIVRVFDGERAVAGLAKEQFRVSEGGEKREIREFAEEVRQMRGSAGNAAGATPRCFTLIFTVFDYPAGLRAALDRFFAEILQPQDQLLVFVNRRPQVFPEVGPGTGTREALDRLLVEQAGAGRKMIDLYVQEFSRVFDMRKFRQSMLDEQDESFSLGTWLKNYGEAWKEYRQRFLFPDREVLIKLAQTLAGIRAEKWLVAFQQLEIHSHITMGRAEFRLVGNLISRLQDLQVRVESESTSLANSERNLRRLVSTSEKALKIADDFPKDEMARLLSQSGATYHAILLPTIKGKDSEASEFDLRGVISGIEEAMEDVALGTGGSLSVTTDPAQAVAQLADANDVLYRLVYSSQAGKEGGVKVDIPGKSYRLTTSQPPQVESAPPGQRMQTGNAQASAAAALRIADLRFENKKLYLEVDGFARAEAGGKIRGHVKIRISIEDNNSGDIVFDQSKDMITDKEVFALALDFPALRTGFYTLAVEAQDLVSEQQASLSRAVQVE